MIPNTIVAASHPENRVLCTALFNAINYLGISNEQAGRAIGMDRTTVSRLKIRGELNPQSKQGELALLLIRIFRSAYALMGGDKEAIRHWMKTENHHLLGVPAQMIGQVQGINQVVEYLDAIRGKI